MIGVVSIRVKYNWHLALPWKGSSHSSVANKWHSDNEINQWRLCCPSILQDSSGLVISIIVVMTRVASGGIVIGIQSFYPENVWVHLYTYPPTYPSIHPSVHPCIHACMHPFLFLWSIPSSRLFAWVLPSIQVTYFESISLFRVNSSLSKYGLK